MKTINISQFEDWTKLVHIWEINEEFEKITEDTIRDVSFTLGKKDTRKLKVALNNWTADKLLDSYLDLFSNN